MHETHCVALSLSLDAYPGFEEEYAMVLTAHLAPNAAGGAGGALCPGAAPRELYKLPGVAETLDWLRALVALDCQALDEAILNDTLDALLKYREDIERVQRGSSEGTILRQVQ